MKQQQMNVYARFIAEETPVEPTRSETKARRTVQRATSSSVRSPKQGLKKPGSVPK